MSDKYEYLTFDRRHWIADEVEELTKGWEFVRLKGTKEIYRRLRL